MHENPLLVDIDILFSELKSLNHTCWDIWEWVWEILSCHKNPEQSFQQAMKRLGETRRFSPHWDMKLRDNVLTHTQRLENMVFGIIPLLEKWNKKNTHRKINIEYLQAFIKVHDIPEWLLRSIWDIPSHIKSQLSANSKKVLWEIELQVLKALWAYTLWIQEEDFEKFLQDMVSKASIEAQLASYLDKLDGFCAAFYEFLHGNEQFIEPLINYIKIFQKYRNTSIETFVQALFAISWDFQRLTWESSGTWDRDYEYIQYSPHLFAIWGMYELWYTHGTWDIWSDEDIQENLIRVRDRFLELVDIWRWDIDQLQGQEISNLPYPYLAWIWAQDIALYNPDYHKGPLEHLRS